MSGSVAPRLPESGWKVLYEDALTRCLRDPAKLDAAGAISDWIVSCRRDGPPHDGVDAGDDVHLSQVPGTRVIAEYLIVESEYLVIVKEFR